MRRSVLTVTCLLWAASAHADSVVASSLTTCEQLITFGVPGAATTPCGFVIGDQLGIRFSIGAPTLVEEFDVFGINAGVSGIDALSNARLVGCPECVTEYDVTPFADVDVNAISSQPFGVLSDGTQYFEYSIPLQNPIRFPASTQPYMAVLSGTNAGNNPFQGLIVGGATAVTSQCCGAGIIVRGEVVPEPSTVLFVGSGLAWTLRRRRASPDRAARTSPR